MSDVMPRMGRSLASLQPGYRGPVWMTTVDKTLTDPKDPACRHGNTGGLAAGSQDLLQQIDALGVPIVYVSKEAPVLSQFPQGTVAQGTWQDSIDALRKQLPHANLFAMANDADKGCPTGVGRVYMLNVQPDQANIPAGFNGIITDNYTPRFQKQVITDLTAAMHGLPATRATWEPTPASPQLSFVQKQRKALEVPLHWLHGYPSQKLRSLGSHVFGAGQTHDRLADMSRQDLAQASLPDLQAMANSLLHPGLSLVSLDTLSKDFMRVITAHGTDAAAVDPILTLVPHGRQADRSLTGPARKAFLALQQANQATPGDWAGFDTYLDRATGTKVRQGCHVEPLVNGSKAFPAMLDAIDHAKDTVNWTSFAFQSDETGWEVARHLAAAADRGCAVKLLYDPIGSAVSNAAPTNLAIFDYLREHGVEVETQKTLPMHVTHRKILVVDGSTGFVGGMNVGNEYRDVWHDVHSKVTGPAVADLQHLFVEQWQRNGYSFRQEDLERFFPSLEPLADGGPARIIGHIGTQDHNMKLAYLRAIDTAEHEINIADPYVTDIDVAEHLAMAARRGVRVRLVEPQHNDDPRTHNIELATRKQLLEAGVELYEYTGRPMAHEKVATFDGKVATIGSSNLDTRSMRLNDEANVWSTDPSVAQRVNAELFDTDMPLCKRITEWNPKGMEAVREFIAPLFRMIQ